MNVRNWKTHEHAYVVMRKTYTIQIRTKRLTSIKPGAAAQPGGSLHLAFYRSRQTDSWTGEVRGLIVLV